MPQKRTPEPERRKYFYSYLSAVYELEISRRTLQRWIEFTNIEPLEFPDQAKVFLTALHMDVLREYKKVLGIGDRDLLEKFKQAYAAEDVHTLKRLRKVLRQEEANGTAVDDPLEDA